jgi:hypothetical protein
MKIKTYKAEFDFFHFQGTPYMEGSRPFHQYTMYGTVEFHIDGKMILNVDSDHHYRYVIEGQKNKFGAFGGVDKEDRDTKAAWNQTLERKYWGEWAEEGDKHAFSILLKGQPEESEK